MLPGYTGYGNQEHGDDEVETEEVIIFSREVTEVYQDDDSTQ